MPSFRIVFDGGSRGNPGPAYGSFRIEPWGSAAGRTERLTFGKGTNNEAEYLSLISALRTLRAYLDGAGLAMPSVKVEIRGDSQLVLRQLKGEWKAKDPRMRALRQQVYDLTAGYANVSYVQHPRRKSVEILGH